MEVFHIGQNWGQSLYSGDSRILSINKAGRRGESLFNKLTAVSILQQRVDFLEGIAEVARDCNWTDEEIQGLLEHLTKELIDIDNLLYDVYEQTFNKEVAFLVWESRMENLRHWLSLILGIKIKYV